MKPENKTIRKQEKILSYAGSISLSRLNKQESILLKLFLDGDSWKTRAPEFLL
jgi:hypothetical protein